MTWDRAGGILDDAHVVDGRWGIAPGALRTGSVGYDRMAAFGDQSWTDYEVEGDVTVHGLDHSGYRSPSNGPGVGILLRWGGHDTDGEQPREKATPYGALVFYRWTASGASVSESIQMIGGDSGDFGALRDSDTSKALAIGGTYRFKMRVDTDAVTGEHVYRFAFWDPATEPEPDLAGASAALVEYRAPAGSRAAGSAVLVAHHADVTFGDVTVRALA
ncbi:MAG TPA: hypothetical protein VM618_03050 [Acidimicrobiia bacterium]|nr:hypothetical protein [Acidimicrobiia bacterium]